MTRTLTNEMRLQMLKEKYVGIFPLEFKEGKKASEGVAAIPDSIQLIPIGQWDHDVYGKILITASDIREFVQNFNAQVRKGVFITAGHEGFEELPANGWITGVEARENGLWGFVDWNELGKATLTDKHFKYFSPEFYRDYEDPQTHQVYRNVLTGGALTKSPYFKELAAIVLSDNKIKKQFTHNPTHMDLKTLLAKDIATLTDAEKGFIKEHASELTEAEKSSHTAIIDAAETAEEKEAREKKEGEDKAAKDEAAKGDANEAAGLNRDGSAKTQVQASEKVMVSASDFKQLQKDAAEGRQAFAMAVKAKITASVKALTFSATNSAGKFLPKTEADLQTFMESLSDTQREAFVKLTSSLPQTQVFAELGNGGGAAEGTALAEVNAKVDGLLKANDKLTYSDALKQVFATTAGLEQRYTSELKPAGKK